MRDQVLSSLPTRHELIAQTQPVLNVAIPSTYPDELARLSGMVGASDIHGIVSRYPVRESRILDCIAKGLRFNSRDDYERAVLRRVGVDAKLRDALKQKLGNLASQLE